jgi:hypothetical protein
MLYIMVSPWCSPEERLKRTTGSFRIFGVLDEIRKMYFPVKSKKL